MIVYRLARKKYMHDLSGKGAEFGGGRWNTKGKAMLYTSGSQALCLVEVLVHLQNDMIPKDYFIVEIDIPDKLKVKTISQKNLVENWKDFPWQNQTQYIGDDFLNEQKFLILKVPSAIVEDEFNFLINPHHPDFSKIKIVTSHYFSFDNRLFINKH